MVLQTERLILRQLTVKDAGFMLELLNESAFIRNVGDRGVRDRADAVAYLEERIFPSYARLGFGFYRVELKEGAIPIGICGLAKRETLDHVDVGFSILERFWGKGYALEAARATMEYAHNILGLIKIIGITAPHNAPSIRLLQKLGLKLQGKVQLSEFGSESLIFG